MPVRVPPSQSVATTKIGIGKSDQPVPERYPEPGGPPERVSLATMPVTVGRADSADFTIYSNVASKRHAAILKVGDSYTIRDLHSTNGTFVNGQRVVEQILSDGTLFTSRKSSFAPLPDH